MVQETKNDEDVKVFKEKRKKGKIIRIARFKLENDIRKRRKKRKKMLSECCVNVV